MTPEYVHIAAYRDEACTREVAQVTTRSMYLSTTVSPTAEDLAPADRAEIERRAASELQRIAMVPAERLEGVFYKFTPKKD